ncbi:site-specific DNA-methyltransferase [Methylomonas sp. EFPC3]|uniref:DNA-methyltransferase n=1 Tax=Methylomonas sp. EFPC3 TaxID=3021710 RepID=UPI0024167578|nr:site-specific DNA-methyltransferase [Methylomonas sp. EFPC3]WFP48501.1 site-specific DNA-methyltransferase [Methylomonas sp. EFPC3]
MEKYQRDSIELHNVDALSLLASLAADTVDLIATDPPYYKVKDNAWDNQWRNPSEFFTWLDGVLVEYHRVLKPAGSLYLFAGPHLATQVELAVAKHFRILNHIVWRKPSGRHNGCRKESLRRYFPQTEHIIFAESRKRLPFAFEPIRSHLEQARQTVGISRKQIDQACGCQMSGHWFDRSQWSMPSRKHYDTMNQLFGGTLKPYAELFAEYKAVKLQQRHFAVTKDVPFTNVWDFKPVQWYPGKHPCEKPLDLMRHIVSASSRPNDVVLDTFAGSGSTAIACLDLGRKFLGCELGEDEYAGAITRLKER